MSDKAENPEEFVYKCTDHVSSDSGETVEPTSEPEPEPEPELEPEPPKKRGRKRLSDEEKAERKRVWDELTDTQMSEKVIVMTQQPWTIRHQWPW